MSVTDGKVVPASEHKPWLLEALALLLLFADMLLAGIVEARKVTSAAKLMGTIFAPAIITLVVVGVAQLANRAISRRGKAKVAVVTLAFVMLGQCGQLGQATRETVADTASARAARFAAEAAKSVPKRVDAETELVSVAAQGNTLVYSYRMVNTKATDVDATGVEQFEADLIKHACGNAAARDQMLRRGITLRHSYFGTDKTMLASVDITEQVCAALANEGRSTTR